MILVAGTTYRSGTTLIQRLLNCNEECLIYGEDNCILNVIDSHLLHIVRSQKRSEVQLQNFLKNKNSFSANMLPNIDHVVECWKTYLKNLYGPSKKSGFKVISPSTRNIETFLSFFKNDAKVVLMYRNLHEAYNSYKNIYNWVDRKTFFSYFQRSSNLLRVSLKGHPNIFPINYSEISVQKINELFDWLEIDNRSNIEKVLSSKIREMDNFDKDDKELNYLKVIQ